MLDAFVDGYNAKVIEQFPPNKFADLAATYYNGAYCYFENFDGFDYLGANHVIGVEKEFIEDFGRFQLKGFIDLILEDDNGNITIVDHKSKKEIKTKANKLKYGRQPFLYSKYIMSTYNKWPKKLIFNMFRSGNTLEIPFTMEGYNEAVKWAEDSVEAIEATTEWPETYDDFFCKYLCGYRESCLLAIENGDGNGQE